MGRAHLALYRGGTDTIEIDEAQMDSRLVLTLALAGVLALTACTGQQATTAASSKAGGPKIELVSTTPDPCPPPTVGGPEATCCSGPISAATP